ncbi:YhjD/YihY/BrkB family envelope integrity protein [Salegentibacter sp. F188]|uniref:YhjD/YihY/BrkB family envelope integrity protein n=1 Tax=Autumnicola patrickiae TaxID=3075591 RepID=A0ABU3E5V9_9FLAO|nr:YhjD/YihY/BrkB family envelope integrity protein [Salegentibacter sp. F188]MDT0690597.1 YhjD/YihY/BrkB family envelope integrity protein [Salegentibacter sp. F188]
MHLIKTFWKLIKRAYFSWDRNDPWARSATIAYYALFSLPSLLIIVVTIAGYFFGEKAVQGRITQQISDFIGPDSAEAIEKMIANAALTSSSTVALIFGFAFLIFGATGVFFQLKAAMNNIWNVTAKNNNIKRVVINRIISLGMVLVVGLLLLVSLVISTVLTAISDSIAAMAPAFTSFMLRVLNFLISLVIITSLFAAIFKWLPDVKLRWKTTYLGAMLTTILFLIAESLIGLYFGQSNPGSIYGGASSVVLILLWVYYTCLIVFFGAEFTVQYALYKKEKVEPNEYAEPAIYRELERLEQKRGQLIDEKRILDTLQAHTDIEEEEQKARKEKELANQEKERIKKEKKK